MTDVSATGTAVETKIRIVIAEDEAIIRLDLKESLEDEDLGPDVVILDIKMPGKDGIEAAREINQDRLAAVLLLTAFSQRDLIKQASEAGALAYLVKPFQRSELVPAIELALGRFRDLRAIEGEAAELQERLETRKVVDRAKGRLMDEQGMTEGDAYRFIQQRAMEERSSMRVVADEVLNA
jgi:AmiR/NasT family two-component response regulator